MAGFSTMHNGLIILDSYPYELIYGSGLTEEISRRVNLLAPPMTAEEAMKRPELLARVEVIFSGWGMAKLDAAFLAAAPKLQAVFYGAGSVRGFTTDESWARGIQIVSAYAMNAVPVSEYTIATVLLSLKNFWRHAFEAKRRGKFEERAVCAGGYGSTVGLISLGMIGRMVRERLRAFDLKVIAYDPFVTPEQAAAMDVEMVTLDEVFRRGDVVSLHTPWLKETEGMIQGRHFELMKERASFLNTARGAVVDEAGLTEVFARRTDLTAILDVTWPEPPAEGSALWTLPNVILTPHIAGSMDNECRRMGRLMIDEFDRWTRGDSMQWLISKEKAALLA